MITLEPILVVQLEEENPDWESAISRPEWEDAGRVHDWRNHVPDYLVQTWDSLTLDAKACCFLLASKEAHDEIWD